MDENLFDLPEGINSWDEVRTPSEGGGGISLPPGFWPAKILDVVLKEPGKGGPHYAAIQMVVDGTDREGERFSDNLHIKAANDTARRIAAGRIKSLKIACGKPENAHHSAVIGEEVIVEIRASINKATGQPNVNVHNYHSVERAEKDGLKIGSSGEIIPVRATESPAQKPEAPKAAAKPWKRQ